VRLRSGYRDKDLKELDALLLKANAFNELFLVTMAYERVDARKASELSQSLAQRPEIKTLIASQRKARRKARREHVK
jgi:hypothetical protein